MWIREGFTDPPRGARTAIALAWARTLGLAIAAVCLGATLDRALAGEGTAGPLALLVLAVLGAAVAGGIAEALPSRIQGREETAWRDRVVAALLEGTLRAGRPTGHPGGHPGGRGKSSSDGSARSHEDRPPASSVGHPGGNHAGHPGARPAGHTGGRPASGASAIDGAAVDAATTGVEKIANYRAVFLAPTLAAFTAPLLVLAVWMIGIDLVSGLGLCVFIALVPLLIRAAGSRLRRPNHEYRRRESEATARYLEMIEGLGTFKVLGAMGRARDEFARSARSAMSELGRLLGRNQLMIIVNDLLFGFLMTGAALALILWRLTAGAITPGQAFAALLLTVLLAEPIDKVGRTFYIGLAGRARREGVEAMLASGPAHASQLSAGRGAAPTVTADPAPAATAPSASAAAASDPASAPSASAATGSATSAPSISIRGLNVSLGGREILHDIDLDLPAGAHIALVGPTGAGKSTLLRVLAGLDHLEATTQVTGTILVDGVERGSAERRAGAAVVAQKAQLASTTVGDNLRLAAPDADDHALTAALARAHLDVATLADGLDTPVGESGAQLSGGQRRRVTLARALLRPRPLLLLDEPTADLDRRTEALVRDTLAAEGRGRTVVHVAHRLDMIAGADLVVVLRDGRIEERGTFAELAARPGYLADALAAEEVRR